MDRLRQLLGRARAKYEPVADTEMVTAPSSVSVHSIPSSALLSVKGMTCSACTSAVEAALRAVPGVTEVQVALLQHSAEVNYNAAVACTDDLVTAAEDCGFDCKLLSVHNLNGGADEQEDRPQVARLGITGMTCAACSGSVERALAALPGVMRVGVSLPTGQAEVCHHPSSITAEALVAAVEDLGFEARLVSKAGLECCSLGVLGMTCSACSSAVEAALTALPGVSSASVSALTGRAEVWYDAAATGPRAFLAAISDAGFVGSLLAGDSSKGSDAAAELAEWGNLLSMALVFTIPVFILAMVLPMLPGTEPVLSAPVFGFRLDELLKWALATPVQFWIGWRFHKGAAKALRRGVANMDVLVALGTDASYFYSVISILHHRFVHHKKLNYVPTDFFETCAMLITVIILGKYLECAAKGKTSAAIQSLLSLAPDSANLVTLDEEGRVLTEDVVESALIHHGDLLKVLPGGRIPADGELLHGSSYINESMISGESAPVLRQAGDALIGGTINTGNALIMRASRVGADTVLAQIVRLVERAQMSKAPIQAYADYVASLFVPVVVGLALMTWLIWFIAGSVGGYPEDWLPLGHTHFLFALLFGIAVLVIACPCALGLATPTAVMVGTGVGAHLGVLIKGGDALERGHHVNTVVFDKTGTLTRGRPQVTEAVLFNSHYSLQQVCQLAAAVESSSEHPLAKAVLEFAQAELSRPSPTAVFSSSAVDLKASSKQQQQQSAAPAGPHTVVTVAMYSLEDEDGSSPRCGGKQQQQQRHGVLRHSSSSSGPDVGWGGSSSSPRQRRGSCEMQPGLVSRLGKQLANSTGGLAAWAGHSEGGEGPGSPVSTPKRLGRMLNSGMLKVSEVENHPGKGVTAQLPDPSLSCGGSKQPQQQQQPQQVHIQANGSSKEQPAGSSLHVALGNRLLMQEQGVLLGPEVEDYMQSREAQGQTCVLVGINGKAVAALAVSDPLKPEALGVVAALQRQGVECHLLTGDNWRTARAIAKQLCIPSSHVSAEVLPAGKAGVVTDLQSRGCCVAMVGDGVNDSPALAAADVGMAIGSGTDIAVEAADYVLMRDDLEQVLIALDLARKTFRRIQWNFVWAMGYNVVMIPIAAGVLYPQFHVQMPPWVAGGCMVFSSVSVVLSSLTLRAYKPPMRVQKRDSRCE